MIHAGQTNPREWDEKTRSAWKRGISMFTVTADPHTAAAKTDAPGVVTLISQTQAGTGCHMLATATVRDTKIPRE